MLSTALFNKIKSHLVERERRKRDDYVEDLKEIVKTQREALKARDKLIKTLQTEVQLLKKQIQKLELNQKTYAGMIFKAKSNHKDDDGDDSASSQPRGGVSGHQGNSRHLPERVDKTVNVARLVSCPKCHGPLQTLKSSANHVVEDIVLPTLNTVVTKYIKAREYCPSCKREFVAHAKEEIPHARFGVNLMSLIMYLRYESKLTLPLISALLELLGGIKITVSGIENQLAKAKRSMSESYQEILKEIRGSPVKHADETGWKVEGEQYWGWLFSTVRETYLGIASTRGSGVAKDYLAGSNPESVLVRDGYAGYDKLKMKTQYCWSHVIRYARDYAKLEGSSDEIKQMARALKEIFDYAKKNQSKKAYPYLLKKLTMLANAETKCEAVRRVQVRLKKQTKGLLTALLVDGVPLTNNQAERDIRPLVIARKLSYGSMSEAGAETTAVNYSIMQTLKKMNLPMMESITRLLTGESIYSLQDNA